MEQLLLLFINYICNAWTVTPKCESEARIVSRQEKMELEIQVLESQREIMSFEPLFEGSEFELQRERNEVTSGRRG